MECAAAVEAPVKLAFAGNLLVLSLAWFSGAQAAQVAVVFDVAGSEMTTGAGAVISALARLVFTLAHLLGINNGLHALTAHVTVIVELVGVFCKIF